LGPFLSTIIIPERGNTMHTTMTLNDLITEVRRVEETKRDFIMPTTKILSFPTHKDVGFELNGNNDIPIGTFSATPITHGQVAAKLQIPKQYYDRIRTAHPELLSQSINTLMKDQPERRLVRTLDGNVRAFLSDRFGVIYDNAMLLRSLLPTLQQFPTVEYKGLAVTDSRLYVQAVVPSLVGEIKKGDPVYAGVTVSNSEVGHGRFMVESMLYILSCTNGAVFGESLYRHHVGRQLGEDLQSFYAAETIKADLKAFELKVRDTVRMAFDQVTFTKRLEDLRASTLRNVTPSKADDTVQEVASVFGLLESEKDDILSRFLDAGDHTQYGLSQAITAHANTPHEGTSFDRVVDLQRIGGQVMALPEAKWLKLAA